VERNRIVTSKTSEETQFSLIDYKFVFSEDYEMDGTSLAHPQNMLSIQLALSEEK